MKPEALLQIILEGALKIRRSSTGRSFARVITGPFPHIYDVSPYAIYIYDIETEPKKETANLIMRN